MNRTRLSRILSVLLAISLVVMALSACGNSGSDDSGDKASISDAINATSLSSHDPVKEPVDYLNDAITITANALEERYSGSPIYAISKSMEDASSAAMSVSLSGTDPDMGDVGISGTVYSDPDAAKFLFDGSVSVDSESIGAQVYYNDNFIGVGCPELFGNDTVYGLRLSNIADQIKNSSLASLMGVDEESFEESIEGLDEIDALLETINNPDGDSLDTTMEKLVDIMLDPNSNIDFTVEEGEVSVGGKTEDGYIFTGTITSQMISDMVSDVVDILKSNGLVTALLDFAAEYSEDAADIESMWDDLDSAIESIKESGLTETITYYVCDCTVVSYTSAITVDGSDDEITISVNYFDGDDNTVSMNVTSTGSDTEDMPSCTMKSVVDSSGGNYNHTLTMSAESSGEIITETIETAFGSNGDLTSNVTMEVDGETIGMTLDGNLTAADHDGFTLSNGTFSVNVDGEQISLNFSISGENGVSVPEPSSTKNIFELPESELMDLLYTIYSSELVY